MPFKNAPNGYQWSLVGLTRAPTASGVYGIFNRDRWIYIGETGDIAARLSEHFAGASNSNPDIIKHKPTGFTFELASMLHRVQRQDQLILELRPACNKKLG